MPMTSHQIAQMASSQSAMFGQFQSYAQQITPPYGARPGMGYMAGASPAPPPMQSWSPHSPGYGGGMFQMMSQMPYAQPGSGYSQALGGQILGGGLNLASAGISGLGTAVGVGGMIGAGASALGMGGMGMSALGLLGGPVGMLASGGIAVAGFGANQMRKGLQQRQQVNQVLQNRFGGAMGVGSGRGGRGFSTSEMDEVSSMLREMGTEDMFSSMEELTRVMDRTAQMGVYKGINSARQFKQRFQQTIDSLKEIAQTMNTTLEGATEFMQQSRGMGFFSGKDISRNLMQTRLGAAATGMSVPQMQQIGMMGTQMGMSMGWRGRTGAQAAQNIATNIGTAVQGGSLSEEQLFEATGGLTGAEGVQALTSRMMQVNNRFLSRGAGRVLTAAMWDPESGGINREMMEKIQRGEISFQEARRIGRRNIAQTGGRRSEFFANEERIRGQAMEEGGSDMTMGMIEGHFGRKGRGVDLDSSIVQRFMRRRLRMSQPEVEAFIQLRRDMPRIMAERRQSMRQELSNMAQSRRREGQGMQGVRRRWVQWWERSVENPLRQAADDLQTQISEGIEGMMNDMEGRIQTSLTSQTQSMVQQWARTGQRPTGMMSSAQLTKFSAEARRSGSAAEAGTGFFADLGRAIGTRGPGQIQQLRSAQAYAHGLPANASNEERAKFLQTMQRDLSTSYSDMGFTSAEMKDLGSKALDEVYGSMSDAQREEWVNSRSNKDKAISMAKDRIRQLKRTEWGRKYFSKAKNWYQGYAALTELEDAAGLGVLGVDTDALPGGGGGTDFITRITGARKMQEEALGDIVSLSRRGREDTKWGRAGWGEKITRGGLAALSLGASELLGGEDSLGASVSSLFGREGKIGGGLDRGTAARLLKNNELREDLRLARQGDKAARQRLTKASLAEGVSTVYGEAEGDRNEMQTLINMATKGSASEKDALDRFVRGATGEQQMILAENVKKSAADLSRFTSRSADTLREGMGEDAFNRYQRIIELQESGDLDEAMREEKLFFQKYGGSKEGNFLLSHLRKGGVGEGVQEGLATMSDYTRMFRGRSEKQKARSLIEMTLGSAGIRDQRTIRNLLGRGTRGKFMRDVLSGDASAGDLAKRLVGKLSPEQLEGLAESGVSQEDLIRKLTEQIKIGADGVTMKELQKSMAGQATDQAWGARISGAPKEQVDSATQSLTELKKTNFYLKALLTKQIGQDGLQKLIEAARKGANNNNGDQDTGAG